MPLEKQVGVPGRLHVRVVLEKARTDVDLCVRHRDMPRDRVCREVLEDQRGSFNEFAFLIHSQLFKPRGVLVPPHQETLVKGDYRFFKLRHGNKVLLLDVQDDSHLWQFISLKGEKVDPLLLIARGVHSVNKDIERVLLLDLHAVLDHGDVGAPSLEALIEEG